MKKTLQIRQYVLDLLYLAKNTSYQLMSARDLATHFSMAVSTVALELKKLTEEGYIYSRPGIGNFTNPKKFYASTIPRVGFIFQRGELFSLAYGRRDEIIPRFTMYMRTLHCKKCHIQQIMIREQNPEKIVREIMRENIDALAWYELPFREEKKITAVLRRIADKGIKVVCQSLPIPGINTVASDFAGGLTQMAHALIARKYRRVLLMEPTEKWRKEFHDVFLPLLQSHGVEFEVKSLPGYELVNPEDIGKVIGTNYDCVIIRREDEEAYRRYLKKTKKTVDILQWIHYFDADGNLVMMKEDIKQIGDTVAGRLEELLNGDTECKHVSVPMQMQPGDDPE